MDLAHGQVAFLRLFGPPSTSSFAAMRCEEVLLGVHDRIEALLRDVVRPSEGGDGARTFLDVGCWDGSTTRRFAEALGAGRVLGVEYFPDPLK
jgi:SAM-dependent methyltransferase